MSIGMGGWARRVRLAGYRNYWKRLWRLLGYRISGYILDAATGDPIPGGEVIFEDSHGTITQAIANALGYYEIMLGAETYDIVGTGDGYDAGTLIGRAITGDEALPDFDLAPIDPVFTDFDLLAADNTALGADVIGIVDDIAETIDLEVPSGTVVTALVPRWVGTLRCEVTVGGVSQINGVDDHDFTAPVNYVIVRDNDATNFKQYEVTVTIAP